MMALLRQSVLKPIQFDGQLCDGTKEVEGVFTQRMLTAKFKSSKTPRSQSAPQLLFFVRLFATETTGVVRGIHKPSVEDNF